MSDGNDNAFFYVLQDDFDVLFIDDDPIFREFAQVHLATDNNRVEAAEDGQDGLDRLMTFKPDLILVDLEMPRMNGFEFLEQLRKDPAHARTPVIVVTGREDVRAIDRAFKAGATSFVVKPINWRLLAYQIRFVARAARADAEANERLMRVVNESSRFVKTALKHDPALRDAACEHAYALELAVSPKTGTR
jgi:DNA-binding response OmpR family regulator